MKQKKILTVILLLTFMLTACSSGTIQTVEVTRIAPQTIEVTRIVQQTVIAPPAAEKPSNTTAISTTAQSQPIQDLGYYDGIVVITQYYTFLGYGLHEEAYRLLSSSAQSPQSLEDYVVNKRRAFQKVEIITIEPCTVWSEQHGGPPRTDSVDSKCFAVEIRAWGEGRMSGSAVSGDLQLLFLTLVLENDEWKIDSFATALLH